MIIDKSFQFGEWLVTPSANCLVNGSSSSMRQVEPRAMDVLLCLCKAQGEVLSAELLLERCWGTTAFGDNPVHKVITQLRKALGDSSIAPRYIETIRKRGYRVIAPVVYGDAVDQGGTWEDGSPFRGLSAFEETHTSIFFGRRKATAELLQILQSQAQAGCALVLVLGPSGSGKTSLVRAGVFPRLELACCLSFDLADACDGDLFLALASVLLDAETVAGPLFPDESAQSLGQRLRHEPDAVAERLRQALKQQSLGLLVDRFEAIFQLPKADDGELTAFLGALESMARSESAHVVLACRNDYYPQVVACAPLAALKRRGGCFDLNPPDRAEIAQIIRGPARAAGLRYDVDPESGTSLDEVLCGEAQARPDMLPLLQYCLQELYMQREPDGELRFAVYRALGGIEGAIGARAEQVALALSAAQAAALPRVLSQLVGIPDGELPVTSRHLPWSALRDPAEFDLVKALVEARLFVSGLNAGVPTFGIAHDALLRRWPRAADWIESHRNALQLRTRIRAQAVRWQASGRHRDFLLPRGAQANQARDLLQTPGFQFTTLEREFTQATLHLVRRNERRRAGVLAMLAALAVLASVFGLLARGAQQRAEAHRIEAEGLMGFMLGEFVDKLRPLGRLDLLDSVSARALTYLTGARQPDDAVSLVQRAKALQLIAEVKVARADPAGAAQALRVARTILQGQEHAAPGDKVLLKALGSNAFWLGQIQLDQRDWNMAEAHFREYLAYSRRLAAVDPEDPDGWIEESYAHSNLGTVALKRGAVRNAAEEFAASIALKSRALVRFPKKRDLVVDLANSLSWLASAREVLGELDDAMALYQREADLMRYLHRVAPDNGQWTQRYALALWHQADLQRALGNADEARAAYAQSEVLLQTIVKQDPSNRSWEGALTTVQLKRVGLEPGTVAEKISALQALQIKLAALSALEPKKWNLQRLVAMAAARQAELHRQRGERGTGRRLLAEARTVLDRLRQTVPGDQAVLISLSETLLLQAGFDEADGDEPAALSACRQAQSMLRAAAADSTDFHVLVPWFRAARCGGDVATAARTRAQLDSLHYRDSL